MADVYTRIGYIKGATGATGAQGEKGDTGDAATIQVGSVTTVPYGQTANVVNSGTEQAAVFDFTIPQGRPGQQVTEMDNLLLNSITTSAAEFPLPAVGETGKVLWGKVVKWFSDMSALVATKFNTANVVNNLTTTASGYALDARQGKALNDEIAKNLQYSNASITYTTHFGTDAGTVVKIGNSIDLNSRQYNLNTAKSLTASTVLFTLPTGYRPNHNILLSCIASKTTDFTTYVPVIISVTPDGNVTTAFNGTYYQLWIFGTFTIGTY